MSHLLLSVEANPKRGYGRLSRQAILADELTERGHQVTFASEDRIDLSHWFDPRWRYVRLDHFGDLLPAALSVQPDSLIFDRRVPDALFASQLRRLFPLVLFDEGQTSELPADLVVNTELVWRPASAESATRVLGGPRYALLRRRRCESAEDAVRRDIVVSFSAGDPANLTTLVMRSIQPLSPTLTCTVILGQGFRYHNELRQALDSLPQHIVIRSRLTCTGRLLGAHSIAVTSAGGMLYELAHLGVPALCLVDNPCRGGMARALERAGALQMVAVQDRNPALLTDAMADLLADDARRVRMSECGAALIDEHGPARICVAIESLIARCTLLRIKEGYNPMAGAPDAQMCRREPMAAAA